MKTALGLLIGFACTLAAGQAMDAAEFDGRYEARFPELIDTPSPLTTVALECARGQCTFSIGDMRASYPQPGKVRPALLERTQKSVAQLYAGAKLLGCINLAGDSQPDGPFACRLDRDLDGKRAMLIVPPGGSDIMALFAVK